MSYERIEHRFKDLRKILLLDASSAILLAKVGFHEVLAETYRIRMSESVFDEITGQNLPGAREYKQLLQKKRLKIFPVLSPSPWNTTDAILQKLDRGERDTLLLFREGCGDFIGTDDGAAARFFLSRRIPFVNSLLLLRLFHHSGKIDKSAYKAGFQSLLAFGRYSEKVIEYARSCPDNELQFFIS